MDHGDLSALSEDKVLRRVDDLLAERKVDFGDGFSRGGLEAFSADAALQCMPWDVSPLVVYYNPALIDLQAIADPGRRPVTAATGWSLDDFAKAALQARRPGVRGLYVAPDLAQVAPFVWSGGGDVVDDDDEPTRLTLSDGSSVTALEKLLEVVRDPTLTFSQAALRRQSALDRFKAGKLGMILGFRDLTPELRDEPGLTFDVMPLPRVSSGATVAEMSGLCIAQDSDQKGAAADFLAALISKTGASALARTGYVMPANLDVVNSDAFLQPDKNPQAASVFAHEVRDARLLPGTRRWPFVRRGTARELTDLFYQPAILPSLQERLDAVDQASIPMFDPSKTFSPSASPSPTPTQ
jgi:multiple sugar transport system substrate-binding protein